MAVIVPQTGNIASILQHFAEQAPEHRAIVFPKAWAQKEVSEEESISYGELWKMVQSFRGGLKAQGFEIGDRVLLLRPLSADFYAFVMALMASGLTAVFVDAGMGTKRIKHAIQLSKPKAIVTVKALLRFRFVVPTLWKIPVKFSMDSQGCGVRRFDSLLGDASKAGEVLPRAAEDECLITFTSGSTGRPKGADRNHGHLFQQYKAIVETYPIEGDHLKLVDMPGFPVAALVGLCRGVTTVLPPIDFAKPAEADAKVVVAYMRKWGVTNISGAPAYMEKVAKYVLDKSECVESLESLAVGGAPVSRDVCKILCEAYPGINGLVLYGSTEAEPMAHVHVSEVLDAQGDGYLCGHECGVAKLELVNLPEANPVLDENGIGKYRVAKGQIGEVLVAGDHVNQGYVDDEEATRENKLKDHDGKVWHRTGDLGYWDEEDRIWLVGRLKDIVPYGNKTHHPYPVEVALEAQTWVRRAAFIRSEMFPEGIVVIEPNPEAAGDVFEQAQKVLSLSSFDDVPVKTIQMMPVDGRHNSKIDRTSLRALLDSRRFRKVRCIGN
ncbi:MAG: AMP-binding protein [Myxococcota bacterium]|nr:AMP-binding protein [Myxococcota bacterium]